MVAETLELFHQLGTFTPGAGGHGTVGFVRVLRGDPLDPEEGTLAHEIASPSAAVKVRLMANYLPDHIDGLSARGGVNAGEIAAFCGLEAAALVEEGIAVYV